MSSHGMTSLVIVYLHLLRSENEIISNHSNNLLSLCKSLFNKISFLVPTLKPSSISHSVLNSTSVNIYLHIFTPLSFRGSAKHFLVKVQGKTFKKPTTFTYELEMYALASHTCNYEVIKLYLNQFCNTPIELPLADLQHYTDYSATIQACNEKGCGESLNAVPFKTDEYIPTCSPTNIVVQNISTMTLQFKWDALPSGCSNGIILGYHMTLWRTRNDTYIWENVTMDQVPFESNIFEKYEYVCYRVRGYTSKGFGTLSENVCAHTAEDCKLIENSL